MTIKKLLLVQLAAALCIGSAVVGVKLHRAARTEVNNELIPAIGESVADNFLFELTKSGADADSIDCAKVAKQRGELRKALNSVTNSKKLGGLLLLERCPGLRPEFATEIEQLARHQDPAIHRTALRLLQLLEAEKEGAT